MTTRRAATAGFPVSRRPSLTTVLAVRAERSDIEHRRLETGIADLCLANNLKPLTNRHVDLLCNVGSVSVLFEVKTCSPLNIVGPLRCAVIQLLEYRYLYRNKLNPNVRLCIVSERRPRSNFEWFIGYLEQLGIGLIWRNDGDDNFSCTEFTRAFLSDLFPSLNDWETRPVMWK